MLTRACTDGDSLLDELTELRLEVRESSKQACREAQQRARQCDLPYRATLRRIIEDWIAAGSARQKVVCFASAAELGLVLGGGHAEQCLHVATQSWSLNVLYWAASRRLGSKCGRNLLMQDES